VQNALYIASVHAEADKDGNMHATWHDDSCRDDVSESQKDE